MRKSSENRRVFSPAQTSRTSGRSIYEAIEMSALCDPGTVHTLESAIEALREQLATERHRCSQAEERADRVERRVEELRTALADARSSEQLARGEVAWLRSLTDEQRSWRLLRRLRWALRPVLVILLAFATLPVQASSAPHEPYSCRLYVTLTDNAPLARAVIASCIVSSRSACAMAMSNHELRSRERLSVWSGR
jgi:hypothetical protein